MIYRSRTEIVAMILDSANGGATKTKIMYKAFLSYNQLKEYLTMLIDNEMIDYIDGKKLFRTIPANIISLIYCSHQILYNIQVESCSSVITTNIVF